jgi:hypothetical protein
VAVYFGDSLLAANMLNVTDAIFQGVLLMPPKTPEPSSGGGFMSEVQRLH